MATKKPNWARMADAARNRRAELGWRQDDVVDHADPDHGISIDTVRRVEAGDQISYRRQTLAAYSKAVAWPPSALWDIAHGADPPGATADELAEFRRRLDAIEAQVDEILRALREDDGSP